MVMLNMVLCGGRHYVPGAVDGSVYPHRVDPMDLKYLESRAEEVASSCDMLILYATGLTVALTSVVKACLKLGTGLIVMHYDATTRQFYAQQINPYRNNTPNKAMTETKFRNSKYYKNLCLSAGDHNA